MSEWIKVEDRLPENYQEVIAHAPSQAPAVFAATFFDTRRPDGGGMDPEFNWGEGNFYTPAVGGLVTHWMPMPESPK